MGTVTTPVAAPINPRSPRGNQGCWPCRFRKKRCTSTDDSDPVCDDCARFHIVCMGAGEERPRRGQLSQDVRLVIKDWIKQRQKDEGRVYSGEPLSIEHLWSQQPAPTRASSSNPDTRTRPYDTQTHQRRRSGSNIPSEITTIDVMPTYLHPHTIPSTTTDSSRPVNWTGNSLSPHGYPPVSQTAQAPTHARRATINSIPQLAIPTPHTQSLGSHQGRQYLPQSQFSNTNQYQYLQHSYELNGVSRGRTTTQSVGTSSSYSQASSSRAPSPGSHTSAISMQAPPASYQSYPPSSYPSESTSASPINVVVTDVSGITHSPYIGAVDPPWVTTGGLPALDISAYLISTSPISPNSPHASSFTSFTSDDPWEQGLPSPRSYPELYPSGESQEW